MSILENNPVSVMNKVAEFKNLILAAIIFGCLTVAYFMYKDINESFTKSNSEHNAVVAAKATKDLEIVIEKTNAMTEEFKNFKETIEKQQELTAKTKEIEIKSSKELAKAVDKINAIDNRKTTYVETEEDRMKSEIAITSIWEMYQGETDAVKSK